MKHDMIHSDVVLVSRPCIYCKKTWFKQKARTRTNHFHIRSIYLPDLCFCLEAMPLLWREFQSKLGVSETSTWSAQLLGAIPKNPNFIQVGFQKNSHIDGVK